MDDDEQFIEGRVPARKFQRTDILMLGLNLIAEVFNDIGDTFESLAMLTAAHANYTDTRDQFREAARLDIEMITGDPDD